MLVESLIEAGALDVDPELFARDVIVTETVFETTAKAYAAELDTAMPVDVDMPLDPEVWLPMSEALAGHLPALDDCAAWRNSRRRTPVMHRFG